MKYLFLISGRIKGPCYLQIGEGFLSINAKILAVKKRMWQKIDRTRVTGNVVDNGHTAPDNENRYNKIEI